MHDHYIKHHPKPAEINNVFVYTKVIGIILRYFSRSFIIVEKLGPV